ncbi:MAG: HD domain-containing protein [Gammaproteobacteria bacterium]|nr:HD domain-containing protein [Gammaproteobacteria bacterium]
MNKQPTGDTPVLDVNQPTLAKKILGKGGSIVDLPPPVPTARFTDELYKARKIYARLHEEAARIFEAIDNDTTPIIPPLINPVLDVADSIKRNPSAFEWIALTNPDDMSVKQHCINVCILSLKFGYHIGLPDHINHLLGLSGLTFDLGKLLVSEAIRFKVTRLNDIEMNVMQKHPEAGTAILQAIGSIPQEVINACLHHHERLDGSGYPEHLKGDQIDLLSRIIGIIDSYVAITAAKHHSGYAPTGRALDELYKLRNTAYDGELVEAFIRSIGVYPVGTVIETHTGEIGLVVSNDANNKLSPLVLMVLDAQKKPYTEETFIDFARKRDKDGKPLYMIKQAVNPDHFQINPKDYFREQQ